VSTVEVTPTRGCTKMDFSSPVVKIATLREFAMRLNSLAAESVPKSLILTSSHPRIFLAGADLAEIAALDRRSSVAYARLGRRVVGALQSHPAPTVAAVDGSCSGGGFDLVLACDAVIASPNASFSHPGVQRGLVTGWGGTSSLPPRLGRSAARGALLEGGRVALPALVEAGIVHAVTQTPVAAAYDCARRLANLHPSRLRLWRSLRHRVGSALLRALLTRGIID
jgi:enoyl-CoA hydratase/carnithine racemase